MSTQQSMKIPRATACLGLTAALAICSIAASPAQAAAAEPEVFCDAPGYELDIAPVSSLNTGQELTWKSVVTGTTVETFTASYETKLDGALGYDAQGNPIDLLLVNLGGETAEKAGVWAGASGSPVYDADGRLVGAVSYGFTYTGETIAGVTPAAAMKAIGSLPGSITVSPSVRGQVQKLTGERIGSSLKQIKTVQLTANDSAKQFAKTATKLSEKFSGFQARTSSGLNKSAKTAGLPINGGVDAGADLPIVAGGNVVVSGAYGYLASASVGTVTAVCGTEIWAYGHPDSYDSTLGASFHGASTARIVPDGGYSYKEVSSIGRVKGKVTDDRLAGVKGTMGAGADTVPVTSVSRLGSHTSTATTHVSDRWLIGPAAAAHLANDSLRLLDNLTVGSASVNWKISYLRNGVAGELKNANRYSSNEFFTDLVGLDVSADIAALQTNPYERLRVTGVSISANFSPEHRVLRVAGVQQRINGSWKTLKRGEVRKVKRGSTYSFRAVLKAAPSSDSETGGYVPFQMKVPKYAKQNISVKLQGTTSEYDEWGFYEYSPVGASPKNFGEFLAQLDNNARNDEVTRAINLRTSSGLLRSSEKTLHSTAVIDGGSFSFKLQAPKVTKKKRS